MDLPSLVFLAVGLSLDAFAIALSISSSGRATGQRNSLRLSSYFGFFQFFMPILGWGAGSVVQPLIAQFDHWVAFALLAFVGVRMMKSGFSDEPAVDRKNPTKGKTLVILSIATSIDALAVGLSLAFLRVDVIFPSIVIGLVTFALSYGGMQAGQWLSARYGPKFGLLGGIVLLLIGLKILASDLL